MYKRIILIACFVPLALGLLASSKKKDKIEIPIDLEEHYDNMLIQWKEKVFYGEDCTNTSDELVTFSDSIYIDRLYSLPTEMELSYNDIVKKYIEMYAGRRKDQVSFMLGEGRYFFPMFENILDKEGMPLELKYLPVIESALNPVARSRVGATGLWQFMAGTGRQFGLEINSLVDERRDPLKSSKAAVKYLKDMYSVYGDWNLVIAAYNCGPGNVNKAIRRSGGKRDYWAIYPYLPRETRGYVPAFIAATYIMNYYEDHNICPSVPERSASLDTLHIDKNIHFQQISSVLNIEMKDIRKYNPEFNSDIIPGEYKSYVLNLPFEHIAAYISNEDSILAYRSSELLTHRKTVGTGSKGSSLTNSKSIVHRVRSGDTLSQIAKRYGISIAQLKDWNNLKSDRLTIGRRLAIYRRVAAPTTQLTAVSTETKIADGVIAETITTTEQYKIKRGDSWNAIAKKNRITTAQLKSWNREKRNKLIAGQTLNIQKTKEVEIQTPEKILEPELKVVELDKSIVPSLINNYMNNLERDESKLPALAIGLVDSTMDTGAVDSKMLYHKVRAGENIMQIATRYRVTKDDIINWNKLANTTTRIGQRLLIYLPIEESANLKSINEDESDNSIRS